MKETIDVLAVAANEDSTVGKEVEFKDNAYQKLTMHWQAIQRIFLSSCQCIIYSNIVTIFQWPQEICRIIFERKSIMLMIMVQMVNQLIIKPW